MTKGRREREREEEEKKRKREGKSKIKFQKGTTNNEAACIHKMLWLLIEKHL